MVPRRGERKIVSGFAGPPLYEAEGSPAGIDCIFLFYFISLKFKLELTTKEF
jgi:hypothetical protein